jgi:hypothetical protein
MALRTLKNRMAKLAPPPRPPAWRPKRTTAENRDALNRILAKAESLPPDAQRYPVAPEVYEELDRVIAEIDRREKADAAWWSTPWALRGSP